MEAGCSTHCSPSFESTILLRFVSQPLVFNDKQELFSKESDIATAQKKENGITSYKAQEAPFKIQSKHMHEYGHKDGSLHPDSSAQPLN